MSQLKNTRERFQGPRPVDSAYLWARLRFSRGDTATRLATVSRSVDDLAKLAPTVDTGCVNVRRRKLRLFDTRSIPRCLDACLDTERVAGAGRAMLEHRLARRFVIRLLFV